MCTDLFDGQPGLRLLHKLRSGLGITPLKEPSDPDSTLCSIMIGETLLRPLAGVMAQNLMALAKDLLPFEDQTLRPAGPMSVAIVAQLAVARGFGLIGRDAESAFQRMEASLAAQAWSDLGHHPSAIFIFAGDHTMTFHAMDPIFGYHIPQGSPFGSVGMI
jgi:hypothetical protein